MSERAVTANRNMMAQALTAREGQFQRGIKATPWYAEFQREYGEPPDLNTPDYDYRAAWRAGVRPAPDPYDNNRQHWASSLPDGTMLKSPTHPTAWMEHFMRMTGKDPRSMGINDPAAAQQLFGLGGQ